MSSTVSLKKEAALHALELVRDGMVLGLGTGSTSAFFIEGLAERLAEGRLKDICAVPTSEATAAHLRRLGVRLATLVEHSQLDLVVDGADEVDPQLNLIKGLGRALLREKMVEMHAERLVIIVDESKIVHRLGRGPLPVEVTPFEAQAQVLWLESLGCRAELWHEKNGSLVVTDNCNNLIRCWFDDGITDAYALSRILADRPGIIEHGLFLDMADQVIIAGKEGVRTLERT